MLKVWVGTLSVLLPNKPAEPHNTVCCSVSMISTRGAA